jgi:hypothetical protein
MGGTAEEQGPLLSTARKVVEQTMNHECAQVLFNDPVDPVALGLPDYFDVIKVSQPFNSPYHQSSLKARAPVLFSA